MFGEGTREIVDQKGLELLAMKVREPAFFSTRVVFRLTLSPGAPIGASLGGGVPETFWGDLLSLMVFYLADLAGFFKSIYGVSFVAIDTVDGV